MQVRRGQQDPIVVRQAPRKEERGMKRRKCAEEAKEVNSIQPGCSAFEKLHDEGCLKLLRSAYGYLATGRLALGVKSRPACFPSFFLFVVLPSVR